MQTLNIIFSDLTSFTSLLIIFAIIYCWGFKRRRYFILRLLIVPVYIVFSTNNAVTIRLNIIKIISALYSIPYINVFYIFNSIICVFILKFLFKEKYLDLAFIIIIAYISEHICSHVKQLAAWIIQGNETQWPLSSMITELLFAVIVAIVIRRLLKKYFDKGLLPHRKYQILFIVVALIAMMGISSYIYQKELFSVITNLYEIIISVLIFFFLFSIFEYSDKEYTEIVVKNLLDEQLKQLTTFNENYEFLNMKFHNLKKQINGLEEIMHGNAELKEIRNSVELHETNLDTGNTPLNIVIREYAITCRHKNIPYYCMIDGKALSFLSEEDIYGIFHNALSNAIEATEKCLPEERYVSVKVHKADNIVRINIENSFTGELLENDGLPVTTKTNKIGHGFGMKSIKYILKKYNGNTTIDVKNGIFKLNILFIL